MQGLFPATFRWPVVTRTGRMLADDTAFPAGWISSDYNICDLRPHLPHIGRGTLFLVVSWQSARIPGGRSTSTLMHKSVAPQSPSNGVKTRRVPRGIVRSIAKGRNAVLAHLRGSLRARPWGRAAVLRSLELALASPALARLAARPHSLAVMQRIYAPGY